MKSYKVNATWQIKNSICIENKLKVSDKILILF